MTNFLMNGNITIDSDTIQQTDTDKYLGHEIKIRDNQTHGIQRRIGLTCCPCVRKNSNAKVELGKTLHKDSKNTRWWTVVMTNYGVEDQKL